MPQEIEVAVKCGKLYCQIWYTSLTLSEILFIGDQAPRNNLEPESYTLYSMLNSNIIFIK